MNKSEFLDRLRTALNGKIAPNQVQEHVNYYEEYINTQIRMGRSEQEVFESLGEPRLIAKTIIETSGQGRTEAYSENGYQNTGYQYNSYQGSENNYNTRKKIHIPGWLWAIIAILVTVGIFSVIFSVLSFLAPILLPLLVVIFLVKLFRDWLN